MRYAPRMWLALFLAAAATDTPPAQRDPMARRDAGAREAPLPVFAVASSELIATLGPLKREVGAWAEYLVRARGEEDVRVRLSLVPPALDRGRVWLEVTTLGAYSLPFAARLLMTEGGDLERAMVSALGQAPIELSVDEHREPRPRPQSRVRAARSGAADVTVPAGTFQADELRVTANGETTRVWRSAQVPLWGLVLVRGPRQTVELLAYGRQGARTVFPEAQGNGRESAK
jgi:hypothetical protein